MNLLFDDLEEYMVDVTGTGFHSPDLWGERTDEATIELNEQQRILMPFYTAGHSAAEASEQTGLPEGLITEHFTHITAAIQSAADGHAFGPSAGDLSDPPAYMSSEFVKSNSAKRAIRAPYAELEKLHRDLFQNSTIQRLPETGPRYDQYVEEVEMDERQVIVASDDVGAIGTAGLGPCIAICARGKNKENQLILGLSHYAGPQNTSQSGLAHAHSELSKLVQDMQRHGAQETQIYLVGGRIPRNGSEGSLATERNLLSLRGEFNIVGARLHVSEQAMNGVAKGDDYVDLFQDKDGIFFRKNPLWI